MLRNLQKERDRRADFFSRYGNDLEDAAVVSPEVKELSTVRLSPVNQLSTVRLSPVNQLPTVRLSPQRALVGEELILKMDDSGVGIAPDRLVRVMDIEKKRFGRRRKHKIAILDDDGVFRYSWITLKRPHSRKGVGYVLRYPDNGRGRQHTKRKPRRRRHHGTRKPRRRRHHGTKKHRRSTKHRG